MTIKEAIKRGIEELNKNEIEEPHLKARMLLENILEKSRQYIIANDEMNLNDEQENKYFCKIEKAIQHIPIEYLINKKEFMGIDFYVDENVLIPRQDTETLVEEVIRILKMFDKKYLRSDIERENNNTQIFGDKKDTRKLRVLDMCTGSGAIAISIAKYVKETIIDAVDISKKALDIVQKNAKNNGVIECVNVIESNLFENLEDKKYNIIVSNPPYIRKNIINTLDKQGQNEPLIALDGGDDGLDFYKRIISEAPKHLKQHGYLCFEIGYDQKEDVQDLLKCENRYIDIYSKKDLYGNDRIVIAKLKS